MNWTEKYTIAAQKNATIGAVMIVVFALPNAAGAEEPHVHLHVPTIFPGCNDLRYFQDQFRKSLETGGWEFPDGQAPIIALWIKKAAVPQALSFDLLLIPHGKEPWRTQETRALVECSRLVSDAASIAAEMLRPRPTLSVLVAAQWNTGIFPNPWIPAIYFQGGTTLPKRPNLTVYAGLSWTPAYSWKPPNPPREAGDVEIGMRIGTGVTFGLHRTWDKLELGVELTVGMLYFEQLRPRSNNAQTQDGTAPYALVGPRIGYRFQVNNLLQLYLGLTMSGSFARPVVRPSARSQFDFFTAAPASVTLTVGLQR